jgi:hypothetical protein
MDNFARGRRRAVWVSTSSDLHHDAERDLQDLGCAGGFDLGEEYHCFSHSSCQLDDLITLTNPVPVALQRCAQSKSFFHNVNESIATVSASDILVIHLKRGYGPPVEGMPLRAGATSRSSTTVRRWIAACWHWGCPRISRKGSSSCA